MAEQPTPQEPRPSPLHAFAPAVAVLFAVLVVVAVLAIRLTTSDGPNANNDTSSSVTSSPSVPSIEPLEHPVSPTGDPVFDAGVTEVARFVESTRALPFKTTVKVELVNDATFVSRLLDDFATGIPALRQQETSLKALGVIPADTDLVTLSRASLTQGVIGFYDPSSKALVIRGTELNAFTQTTLAHELTHALDDQWFDLNRPELDSANSDQQFGFRALVEGTATWVDHAWTASRSPTERAEALTEERRFALTRTGVDAPTSVIQIIESPYSLGFDFVTSITANGGAAAIDNAYRSPPASSEQIIHPAKYLAGEEPIALSIPPADRPAVANDTLGELGLTEMLSTSLAPALARMAGEGWGGDHYVTWIGLTGTSCLRLDIVGDTPGDSAEIRISVTDWATHQPKAQTAEPTPGVTRVTTCR